jgi:hypothetical protein
VRGLGADIIYDAAVVSPPLRNRVGVLTDAAYLQANLGGLGGKSYVTVAWASQMLTLAATIAAF